MKHHPIFFMLWYGTNALVVLCFLGLMYGIGWEIATESYLKGFSDAVVPATAKPDQKVEAILRWMASGPARHSINDGTSLNLRDPEDTLNYRELLDVCGTATNAFVNLASSSGLKARRLLMLGPENSAKHVVAEVFLGNRWVIVDPSFRTLFRDEHGEFLTKEQLRDPKIFRQATGAIPSYPSSYTYENMVIVRLRAIPKIGSALRRGLNYTFPSWEVAFPWTVLLERISFAFAVLMAASLLGLVVIRLFVRRYGRRRLNLPLSSLRHQAFRAGFALLAR